MRVVRVVDPPPALADALATFEAEFTYPLGAGSFAISHAPRYDAFYATLGDHAVYAACEDGRVLGTIAGARRRISLPDGVADSALYVGDLKIAPAARGGLVLWRLARALMSWAGGEERAFAVVMGGTGLQPPAYSARAGIPAFAEVAELAVLRLDTAQARTGDQVREVDATAIAALRRRWAVTGIAVEPGDAAARSRMAPRALALADGSAGGVLADTARAKRLLDGTGAELRAAHLGSLAWRDAGSLALLLAAAAARAAASGLPQLFAAIPASAGPAVVAELSRLMPPTAVASFAATVFAHGVGPGADWLVGSDEI